MAAAFFNFPYGFFQQQQSIPHSKSEDLFDDESPSSLSRSSSYSSIDYPLDSESSSTSVNRVYKTDSVVAPPPLMPLPFVAQSDSTSNTVSPTGSPVHPSAVQVKRKRGRPPKPKTLSPQDELSLASTQELSSSSSIDGISSLPPSSPPKRKRGRPPGKKKKAEHEYLYYLDESTGTVTPTASKMDQEDKDYSDDSKNIQSFGFQLQMAVTPGQPVKRGRGRPRKYPLATPQNSQLKSLPLSTSLDWSDSFDSELTPFSFEPPSDYAIVDYLRSIVNEQSKSLLGYTEVRGLLECHFGMDLQYRQCYIEESLDLLCPYS